MAPAAKEVIRFIGRSSKRIVISVVGAALVAVGLAMFVLPGPGILVVALGFAVLGTEYAWAAAALERTKHTAERAGRAAKGSGEIGLGKGPPPTSDQDLSRSERPVYYDSYWELLKFTPAERDAGQLPARRFAEEFEIACRGPPAAGPTRGSPRSRPGPPSKPPASTNPTPDAGNGPTPPPPSCGWTRSSGRRTAANGRSTSALTRPCAGGGKGFSPVEAKGWSDLLGGDRPIKPDSGRRPDSTSRPPASPSGTASLEVARLSRVAPDAPLGKGNGSMHRGPG